MQDVALHAVGEMVLDNFVETFNSRDAAAWAASLSFPHVRISALQAAADVIPDERTYVERVPSIYEQADAMGWHHTAWDSTQILAVSPNKIHASAQWCRYTADGERILANNVSYVITKNRGRWGIQARFGVDSTPPQHAHSPVDQARSAWNRLCEAVGRHDFKGVDDAVRLPVSLIGTGEIRVATSCGEIVESLQDQIVGSSSAEAVALQVGERGVNLGIELESVDGSTVHALVLLSVTEHDAHVSALSLLAPDS